MNFHNISFLLGAGAATVLLKSHHRFRPVAVEIASFGLYITKFGRGVLERQIENVEDFVAEVQEHTRRKISGQAGGSKAARGSDTSSRIP
jgi:hypothetical protein